MTKEQFDKAVTLNRHINRVVGEKMRQEIINLIDLHLNARLAELGKQFEEL